MKKILIVTITDNNFGNKLQNYATQTILSKYGIVKTLVRTYGWNNDSTLKIFIKRIFKFIFSFGVAPKKYRRQGNFELFFTKYIKKEKFILSKESKFNKLNSKYDFFLFGSDQIWNLNFIPDYKLMFGALFGNSEKNIAFAPSIGVTNLSLQQESLISQHLKNFRVLSCREQHGSNLLSKLTDTRVRTLIDPTLLLSVEDWGKIERKPKKLKFKERYVISYFLGEKSPEYYSLIEQVSSVYNLKIIDLMDKNSYYYWHCGPSEFVYLIHHASLVVTDSFHGSVFSYLFSKPLKIFSRIDGNVSMNSRLENLKDVLKLPENVFFTQTKADVSKILKTPDYDYDCLNEEKVKVTKYLDEIFLS